MVRRFTARPQAPDPDTAPAGFFFSKVGTVVAAQPDAAHQVFPVNDHPRDKATYRFVIDAPAGWTAATNGVLVSRRAKAGRVVWTFREPDPLASELVQLAVGDFVVLRRRSVRGVPIRDVVPRAQAARLSPLLAVERSQLAWMTSRVGRYPTANYGSLVFDAAIGYSLETQTLSLFDAPVFATRTPVGLRNGTMLHELAHEWFGDSVSPYAWSDIWLNEGHATWYEAHYDAIHGYLKDDLGYPDLESYFKAVYRQGDKVRDEHGPVARPRSGAIDDLFNPNVYDGGALALYALRQKMGAKRFNTLERRWVAKYRGQSASTDDFIALASRVAGRDLRTFLIAWLYGTRTPPMPGHPDWAVDPVPAQAASSTQHSLTSAPARTATPRRVGDDAGPPYSPEPGLLSSLCVAAFTESGVSRPAADMTLFIGLPATTFSSPFMRASKPCSATLAGSSCIVASEPARVSSMSAREKKFVLVTPGIRDVTVTPLSSSSLRIASAKDWSNALVAA